MDEKYIAKDTLMDTYPSSALLLWAIITGGKLCMHDELLHS